MNVSPNLAVTYARVSTYAQKKDGNSLDSQKLDCLDYAERINCRLLDTSVMLYPELRQNEMVLPACVT